MHIATNQEIRTEEIIETALSFGKIVAAPKCFGKNMEFFCFSDLTELRAGAFGILEPQNEKPAFPDENTLMLVPGMAFDRNMNRIGYGGGYYDRYFEKYRDIAYFKLGLAYEFQIYDSLEVEEHDYRIGKSGHYVLVLDGRAEMLDHVGRHTLALGIVERLEHARGCGKKHEHDHRHGCSPDGNRLQYPHHSRKNEKRYNALLYHRYVERERARRQQD